MKIGQLGSARLGTALSALESAHLDSARGFVPSSVYFGSVLARGSARAWLVKSADLLMSQHSEQHIHMASPLH